MKTIGLIGGMSWESTVIYYRLINEGVKLRLGGHHSAKLLLNSVDFEEIKHLQHDNRWEECAAILAEAAKSLADGGAECIVLCTNTMHKIAYSLQQATTLPFLHIADPTGRAINAAGLRRIGLLGTRFTMEQEFYAGYLHDRFGIEVLTPDAADRDTVHRVIYDELTLGKTLNASRDEYLRIVERLVRRGAQGIILGCTEIAMLIQSAMLTVPCFDTTQLHAAGAVEFALG